jgi:hypothetical protein
VNGGVKEMNKAVLGDGNGRNSFNKRLSISAMVDRLQVFLTTITRQQATLGELRQRRKLSSGLSSVNLSPTMSSIQCVVTPLPSEIEEKSSWLVPDVGKGERLPPLPNPAAQTLSRQGHN